MWLVQWVSVILNGLDLCSQIQTSNLLCAYHLHVNNENIFLLDFQGLRFCVICILAHSFCWHNILWFVKLAQKLFAVSTHSDEASNFKTSMVCVAPKTGSQVVSLLPCYLFLLCAVCWLSLCGCAVTRVGSLVQQEASYFLAEWFAAG